MQKLEPLQPGKTYKIVHRSNGDEFVFVEETNKIYFRTLMEKHLVPVCEIVYFEMFAYRIELVLKFHESEGIPERFREKLHLPISNLLNSYTKSINKRYNREGSLFRKRF